MSVKVY